MLSVPVNITGAVCTESSLFPVFFVSVFLCPVKPHLEWDLLGIPVGKQESKAVYCLSALKIISLKI